ncbi:MAG: flagellar motor protein MotD [Gammaproteobacteria bacterium]|nr:flagellar motor protein MotD [Gammaproteobacteria bacterium]
MARHKKHEEHLNHEAWAIPYGDLITLLLAFFVVMYALSSVNEGKYRALADSLATAFAGAPRSPKPIQIGEKTRGTFTGPPIAVEQQNPADVAINQQSMQDKRERRLLEEVKPKADAHITKEQYDNASDELNAIRKRIENAMSGLIARKLVDVKQTLFWVEVKINADILFPSGVSRITGEAIGPLTQLADALIPFPNNIRVEGHTDNLPINTIEFPSNWELSAARAASVVHLFMRRGVEPVRLALIGHGENRPVASNETSEGRNKNRRVVVIIMADGKRPTQKETRDEARDRIETAVSLDDLPDVILSIDLEELQEAAEEQ